MKRWEKVVVIKEMLGKERRKKIERERERER